MSSNNCGKGLVVFSIAFVLGLCLSDIFTIQESVKPKATEKITIFEPPKPNLCLPEYKKFDKLVADSKNQGKLGAKKAEVELLKFRIESSKYSAKEKVELKKKIDKIKEEIDKLEESDITKRLRLAEENWSDKRTLLYTEKCYEHKF